MKFYWSLAIISVSASSLNASDALGRALEYNIEKMTRLKQDGIMSEDPWALVADSFWIRKQEKDEVLKQLERLKDPEYCYETGMGYLTGNQYMLSKPETAKIWFKRAAMQNHRLAIRELDALEKSNQK